MPQSVYHKFYTQNVSLGADERKIINVPLNPPTGSRDVSLNLIKVFNGDWVRVNLLKSGAYAILQIHNEYVGPLSGDIELMYTYTFM